MSDEFTGDRGEQGDRRRARLDAGQRLEQAARGSRRPAPSARRSRHRSCGHARRRPRNARINSSSAPTSPETTTAETPLTAAIFSRSPARRQQLLRPRQAAGQRDHAPGTRQPHQQAGCAAPPPGRHPPATAPRPHMPPRSRPANGRSPHPGCTPTERHNSASDTITAHSTGCTTSTRSSPGAPAAPRMTSINDHSTCSPSAFSQRCICSANTGEVSSNSAPMPTHCEPWPGNTNTVLPTGWARPTTTFGARLTGGQPGQPRHQLRRGRRRRPRPDGRTPTASTPTTTPRRPHHRPGSARTCANNRSAWPAKRLGRPRRQHPRNDRHLAISRRAQHFPAARGLLPGSHAHSSR